jgi:protein-S-isoprenylcysteine O-methyltransferase Ste14
VSVRAVSSTAVTVPAAAITFGAWVVGEIWLASRRRHDGSEADRGSRVAVQLSLVAGCLLATWATSELATAAIRGEPLALWVGLAVAWCGILLRWRSARELGKLFTVTVVTSPEQQLIDSGPYRVLRHPSYAGLMLTLGGFGLMMQNWAALASLTLLPAVGLAYRMRVEEAAMAHALGDAYLDFADGRKRLIPYIW